MTTLEPPMKRPTLEELKSYCLSIDMPALEAEKCFDYYESNGWRVGRNPMKSWPAACRNWLRNLGLYNARQGPQQPRQSVASQQESIWSFRGRLKAHKGNPNHVSYSQSSDDVRAEFRELLAKFEQMGGGRLND